MPNKQQELSVQFHQIADALIIAFVYWVAHALREQLAFHFPIGATQIGPFEFGFVLISPFRYYKWLYLVILPLFPLLLDLNGFYNRPIGTSWRQTFWILCKSIIIGALLIIAVMFFMTLTTLSRGVILLFAVMSVGALFLKDLLVQSYLRSSARQKDLATECLLVGPPEKNKEFEILLQQHPEWRLVVAECLDPATQPLSQLPELLHRKPIGCVIFNVTQTSFVDVQAAILACETEGVEAWLVADFFKTSIARATIDEFGGKPLLVFRTTPDITWQLVAKRFLDIIGAAVGLLILGPFVMLPAALAIRLTTQGPMLFRQQRSGLRGRPFTMYKFRSMVDNAEMLRVELESFNEASGPVFKIKSDPRVTPVGRFIRKTSIDELPQLWNVLKGDMSLVGPRPPVPSEVLQYDPWHRRRLSMKPGLTCLWQIRGRSSIGFEQWMKLDLDYIDHWSLWLDIKILCRTIPVVIGGFGAH